MKKIVFREWNLAEKIFANSFSTVYKATKNDGSICAIKHIVFPREKSELDRVVRNGYANNYQEANNYYLRAVNNEVVVMKKFNNSPNIVSCYDACMNNRTDGSGYDYYIRMEYVEDIKSHYSKKSITQEEVIKLGIDICSALELCSSINLIHCDIKPENIFIDDKGNYKLGDFSSALIGFNTEYKRTGTLNYISPEVYNGKKATNKTDIYSLGLLMYQLLNGNLPFVSKNVNEALALDKRMSGKVFPDIKGVNKKLMDVILRACSFDSNSRFWNATEMKDELEKITNITPKKLKVDFLSNNNISKKTNVDFSSNKVYSVTLDINDPSLIGASDNIINKSKLRFNDVYNIRSIIVFLIMVGVISTLGTTYALNRDCDSGYVNKYGMCVSGYYYCDEGYSLNDDNECQKTVESKEAKIVYNCPTGYTLNGEYCVSNDVKEPKFEYLCADGFTLQGQKCVRTESINAIPSYGPCSDGYVLAGDTCMWGDAEPIYGCSDLSYTFNANNRTCSKKVTKTVAAIIDYTCPSGSVRNGAVCEYRSASVWNCHLYGATFQGGVCKTNAKLSYSCADGGTLNSNMNCVVTENDVRQAVIVDYNTSVDTYKAPVKYGCPDGSKLSGNKCYGTVSSDAVGMYTCPEGFVVSGVTCIQENFPTPVKKYSCSRVYTLNGGMCEKYEIVPAKKHYND